MKVVGIDTNILERDDSRIEKIWFLKEEQPDKIIYVLAKEINRFTEKKEKDKK